MKRIYIFFATILLLGILTPSCGDTTKVRDIDGNVYRTVIIGDQEWLTENLRVTKYNNGDAIPSSLTDDDWENTTEGAYAIHPHGSIDGLNSDEDVIETYGALYNWHAVDTGKLCPEGWRVPTDDDWTRLTDYLGGRDIAGGKLKATGTLEEGDGLWGDPNEGATNETGFSALPGGHRYFHGGFDGIGHGGDWWSSSEASSASAWYRYMGSNIGNVRRGSYSKEGGFLVRCFRDVDN